MKKMNYEMIQETVYSKILPNGLTVYLIPKRERAKTYGLFTTNYGSMDQTFVPIGEEEPITVPDGIAHFLEHKLFEKEDRDVFADFGRLGASPNAYTSFTKTAYLFSATDNIEANVETLLDFVQDPYFSEASVEKEKGIITQEIKMYDDQPDWQSFIGTVQGMFKNHPIKIDIAGTVESIQTITKDDLYTCYHTFYHPTNMTLCVVGNFEAEEMMTFIEENQMKKQFVQANEIKRSFPEEPAEVAMKERKIVMPVSIAQCTVGVKEVTTKLSAEEFIKRDLLQEIILDYYFSKAGKFYEKLYDENLISSNFSFSTTVDRNFGYSLIGGQTTEPDRFADKMIELLLSTNDDSLSEETFLRLKNKKLGRLLRAMNSLEYLANETIHYHINGIDFFQLSDIIQSLTLDEANDFLKDWITEDKLTVCKIVAK